MVRADGQLPALAVATKIHDSSNSLLPSSDPLSQASTSKFPYDSLNRTEALLQIPFAIQDRQQPSNLAGNFASDLIF